MIKKFDEYEDWVNQTAEKIRIASRTRSAHDMARYIADEVFADFYQPGVTPPFFFAARVFVHLGFPPNINIGDAARRLCAS